jgi:outer membrane protein TolC
MKQLFIVLSISFGVISAQDNPISLEESLRLGLRNSKEIAIANSKHKSSLAALNEISSQMLPKVTFGAGYTRLSDIPPFEVNVPIFPTPIKIQDPVLNVYNLKLSVEQPLFTGFRLSSLKSAAELNSKANKVEFDQSFNNKALAIYNSFWNYYKLQQVYKLVSENLTSLKNHLKDTEQFLEAGLVTENDALKLKVQIANVELKLIDSQNGVEISRSVFNKELGLPLDSQTTIEVNEPEIIEETINSEELVREAVSNRAELKSIGYRVNAGEEAISAANAGWYPQVFAFGNFYYSKPNQRILPLEDEFADSWDVGVGLQWNLWDWGNNSAKAEQAEENVFQARKNAELVEEGVRLEVYGNYLKLKSSLDKITVGKLAVESAQENYRITKEKYNQQLATSTDLIDAEVELLNAQTNLTNTLVDYELAKVTLNKSVGRRIY